MLKQERKVLGLLPVMQGTVKYPSAMVIAYKGNSKTIQARHSGGVVCKAAGKALLQMCHGKLYPSHPSWPPTAREMLGISPELLLLQPRGGRVASTAKKGGEDARMGQVLLSCRSLGCPHTDKLRAESGGWSPSALTVNPWKEEDSVIIILFWVGLCGLVNYLGEAVVATSQMSLISEFPEAVGGKSRNSQLVKENWKCFTRAKQWAV